MFTIQIDAITAADGTTPLLATSQSGVVSGRKIYNQATVGLIDPNVYFRNPDLTGSVSDAGFRLDTAHVLLDAPGAVGDRVDIVDPFGNFYAQFLDLEGDVNFEDRSRSFPIPPGYLISVVGVDVNAIRLGLTQLQYPADLQYFSVQTPEPPA